MLLFSLAIVEPDGRSGPPGDVVHRPRAATHKPAEKRQPFGWLLFNRWTASAPACDAAGIAARTLPNQRVNKSHENNNIFPNGLLHKGSIRELYASSCYGGGETGPVIGAGGEADEVEPAQVVVQIAGGDAIHRDVVHRPRAATHKPAEKRQPFGWLLFNRWTASAPACDAAGIAARTLPNQRVNKSHENNNIFPNGLLHKRPRGLYRIGTYSIFQRSKR